MSDSVVLARAGAATTEKRGLGPRWSIVERRVNGAVRQTVFSPRLARFLGDRPNRLRGTKASGLPRRKRGAEVLVVAEGVDSPRSSRPLPASFDDAASVAGGAEVILGGDDLDRVKLSICVELRKGMVARSPDACRRRAPGPPGVAEIPRETEDVTWAHRRHKAHKGRR